MQWLPVQSLNEADIAFGLVLFAIVLLSIALIIFERRLNRFLIIKNAETIEDTIRELTQSAKAHQEFQKEVEQYLSLVEERLRGSVRGVGVMRFNPFRGTGSGGNQSFATAFIDEHGNGVVISSLYSREHTSVYAKPVVNFASEFDLTLEEREAIKKAKGNLLVKHSKNAS